MTAQELCQWFAERERQAAQVRLAKHDQSKPIVKPKPVDAARRRVIGYNGYGQVKRNGQVFRTHSGRKYENHRRHGS